MEKHELHELTPGEVLIAKMAGHAYRVVFVGIDRGLAVVAVQRQGTYNPFWVDADGTRPHLRNTVWVPKRVRLSSIVGVAATVEAQWQADRDAAKAARDAAVVAERERRDAANRLADVMRRLGVGVQAFGEYDGVRIYGDTAALDRFAALLDATEVAA